MNQRLQTVTIIIPTFNGVDNLRDVCNGIERQSMVKNIVQIIIVDDASTISNKKERYDRLLFEYPQLPLEVVYLGENRGPATARNAGVKRATGEVVFFTDDDCVLPSNAIEQHLQVYRQKPQVSGVGGWYQSFCHVVHENTVERYLFIQSIHIFGMQLYNSASLSSDFLNKPWLFPAVNTANLSVKRYVLHDVLFDEDFVAPGMEDIFFSDEVRRRGYIMQYIPLFVFHRKNLILRKYWKHCRNRGIGLFVYNKRYGRKWLEGIRVFREVRNFNNTVNALDKLYPQVARRRWRMLVLHALRYFIYSSRIMRLYYAIVCYQRTGSLPKQKYSA